MRDELEILFTQDDVSRFNAATRSKVERKLRREYEPQLLKLREERDLYAAALAKLLGLAPEKATDSERRPEQPEPPAGCSTGDCAEQRADTAAASAEPERGLPG